MLLRVFAQAAISRTTVSSPVSMVSSSETDLSVFRRRNFMSAWFTAMRTIQV